ncbi:MAG: stage 0 sporulation protein [Oscillospiraceae bacterium]|nr:stage 0 sporulation protein [Oscillospiraceae bacterium]
MYILSVKVSKYGDLMQFKSSEDIPTDSYVCVESNGPIYALVISKNLMLSSTNTNLPKILRVANTEDKKKLREMKNMAIKAHKQCVTIILENKINMKLLDTEYTQHNNKYLFYFKAETRVDFRQIAKNLASKLKAKIEFRQIGPRDQAKIIGGIGLCGRELCCRFSWCKFRGTSIKNVQKQFGISDKISGICGRIMCCFQFESPSSIQLTSETSKKESKRTQKKELTTINKKPKKPNETPVQKIQNKKSKPLTTNQKSGHNVSVINQRKKIKKPPGNNKKSGAEK